MQFADVIRSVRRHWRMSVAILLLTATVLGLFLFTRDQTLDPDEYRTTVSVLVPARDEDGNLPEGVPVRLLQGQTAMARTSGVIEDALDGAGLGVESRNDFEFGVTSNERGDVLTLSVTGTDRTAVDALAGNYGTSFIEARRESVANSASGGQDAARSNVEVLSDRLEQVEQELEDQAPALLDLLEEAGGQEAPVRLPASTPIDIVLLVSERQTLQNRIQSSRLEYAERGTEALVPQSYATVIDRTGPIVISPEPPSPLIPIAIAVGLGLVLAVAVPVLVDRMDRTIRDRDAASDSFGAPTLATIPASSSRTADQFVGGRSEHAQAYRALAATSIATDELPRAIVVTSARGEAQDAVAANFGAALADLGLRVALVATDPRQAWFAPDRQPEPGATLSELLATDTTSGTATTATLERLLPTARADLWVLPSGDAHIEDVLDGLPSLLDRLMDSGIDVAVVAAPSILDDPAGTIFAWSTRHVLWVVEAGTTSSDDAVDASSRMELAGVAPFGLVMIEGRR